MLPLFAVLVALILAVTALCLVALRTHDLARTAARLAAVSADPVQTSAEFVRGHDPHARTVASVDGGVVTVSVTRTLSLDVPLFGRFTAATPFTAEVSMPLEPPP